MGRYAVVPASPMICVDFAVAIPNCGDRVKISGRAILYLQGEIKL